MKNWENVKSPKQMRTTFHAKKMICAEVEGSAQTKVSAFIRVSFFGARLIQMIVSGTRAISDDEIWILLDGEIFSENELPSKKLVKLGEDTFQVLLRGQRQNMLASIYKHILGKEEEKFLEWEK